MHPVTIALTVIACCTLPLQAFQNTTQDFMLKTKLKAEQPSDATSCTSNKTRFDNLWVTLHPTGAGFHDAILIHNENSASALNGSLDNAVDKNYYSTVAFDPANNFYFQHKSIVHDVHYFLDMQLEADFGAAWEPVRINVAPKKPHTGGFWTNENGLQWSTTPAKSTLFHENRFGGWLVCDWFHNAPQLFFRISSENWMTLPDTCAEVNLVPEYI